MEIIAGWRNLGPVVPVNPDKMKWKMEWIYIRCINVWAIATISALKYFMSLKLYYSNFSVNNESGYWITGAHQALRKLKHSSSWVLKGETGRKFVLALFMVHIRMIDNRKSSLCWNAIPAENIWAANERLHFEKCCVGVNRFYHKGDIFCSSWEYRLHNLKSITCHSCKICSQRVNYDGKLLAWSSRSGIP